MIDFNSQPDGSDFIEGEDADTQKVTTLRENIPDEKPKGKPKTFEEKYGLPIFFGMLILGGAIVLFIVIAVIAAGFKVKSEKEATIQLTPIVLPEVTPIYLGSIGTASIGDVTDAYPLGEYYDHFYYLSTEPNRWLIEKCDWFSWPSTAHAVYAFANEEVASHVKVFVPTHTNGVVNICTDLGYSVWVVAWIQ